MKPCPGTAVTLCFGKENFSIGELIALKLSLNTNYGSRIIKQGEKINKS